MLASLPGAGGKVGRQLSRRLERIAQALARVEAADGPRRARQARQKARAGLQAFVGAVRSNRRRLGGAVERQLTRSAKTAIANLARPSA